MGQLFNACEYLLDRRVAAGDGQRVALAGPARATRGPSPAATRRSSRYSHALNSAIAAAF